ncbi:GDCCVxC domain-containing (seleno)protein [Methylomonas sp. LW13]
MRVPQNRDHAHACQWFYECQGCHTLLKPKPGDCCVF